MKALFWITQAARAVLIRRRSLAVVGWAAFSVISLCASAVNAFGEEGVFHPRVLLTGNGKWEGARTGAPARWAYEVIQRTSAPARLAPSAVRADDPELLSEPFVIWGGDRELLPLTDREVGSLRHFFHLGGVMLVDDFVPTESGEPGSFGLFARREIARVLAEGAPIAIGPENVLFRSFYLLKRAAGRIAGRPTLDAIVRKGAVQVIFTEHDLLGSLARAPGDVSVMPLSTGAAPERERAIRLAVNIAMYVLCSNYKDDQVHAPFLMRRRSSTSSP